MHRPPEPHAQVEWGYILPGHGFHRGVRCSARLEVRDRGILREGYVGAGAPRSEYLPAAPLDFIVYEDILFF